MNILAIPRPSGDIIEQDYSRPKVFNGIDITNRPDRGRIPVSVQLYDADVAAARALEDAKMAKSANWQEATDQATARNEEKKAKAVQKRAPIYDKSRDEHYNLISALHKSLRGSDANASLYWLARMLVGGESPLYIVRRLVRFAVEDIGLADPDAVHQALAAKDTFDFLGSPEGELAIAQAVIYLATAPKSNAAYAAFSQATQSARETGSLSPPKHILNAPTRLMKDLGYGKDYAYDHDAADSFSGQNYFPDNMVRVEFYIPSERGFEREVGKRLAYWRKLRDSGRGRTE